MYGGNYNNFKGKKYEEANTKDIPKLIKQYIKKKYPNVQASVRLDNRGLTTTSINVKFTKLPYLPYTEEYLKWYQIGRNQNFSNERNYRSMYNDKYKNMVEDIKMFASQYNHNYSDTMTDYFDERFYLFIDIDYEYEEQLRNGVTKKVSKQDIEERDFQSSALSLTDGKRKPAYLLYVDTSNGRRYYTWGGFPIKKALLDFMDKNGYEYKLERKR